MADPSSCLPLTWKSIKQTHTRIESYIHRTPLITSRTLNKIASSSNPSAYLHDDPPGIWSDEDACTTKADLETTSPTFNLYFKMENHQRIGAFKARGAFSALTHLANPSTDSSLPGVGIDDLRRRGVITHSSGNHAQALALAASTLDVPAWIVMPTISTKSKISGTKGHKGVTVVFSGSTAPEREEVVQRVIEERRKESDGGGPILVPPYDHADIVLGQGTAGMEAEEQFRVMKASGRICSAAADGSQATGDGDTNGDGQEARFDAVLTPLGGGGLLSGTATWYSRTSDGKGKKTLVFGCEPNFEGANDGERGLASDPPERIPHVKTLTIADGLRTPVGIIPWSIISDKSKVEGVFSVSEMEIKMALKLMMERVKVVIEPSSAVPVAVVLFNERFRKFVAEKQRLEGGGRAWDVGIVISGGNTTVEGLSKLYDADWQGKEDKFEAERQTGEVGMDGRREAEDVAG